MRKWTAGALIGVAAAILVVALDLVLGAFASEPHSSFLDTLELKTYDWRLRRTATPADARKDLALVEIDEYSLRNLEPNAGRWPWPRAIHSMIIDFLARGPARVIGYDVLFAEADSRTGFQFGGSTWSGKESDQALIDSVKQSGNVILLADALFESATVGAAPPVATFGYQKPASGSARRQVVFPPFAGLDAVAAGFGHNLFVIDADSPLRHTIPFVSTAGNVVLPSFGLAAAVRAAAIDASMVRMDEQGLHAGGAVLPLEWRRVRSAEGESSYQWGLIDFRGPALLDDLEHRPYPSYRAFDLINAENQILNGEKPAIDPAVFKDKVVFVGVTASGLSDTFGTPFAGAKMPGIQVHAAVVDDLLSKRFIAPASTAVRLSSIAICAIAAGTIAAVLAAWWASLSVAIVLTLFVWMSLSVFSNGVWLNLSQPVLASSVALFGGVAYQFLVEGREKRKMKRLFGQYVSKDIYEQLVADPERARLGGQRREMTVLFSDIRGFTTLSEHGAPEDIVGMLNEYFTRMVAIVFAHHGTIDKFVGDMVMALFNAPLDDPAHADHAVESALEMSVELARLNEKWRSEGKLAGLDIGIGINTGPMIAGNIGSEQIMSYTVIGDAVNLGSRLESLNKQYGTRIIISDATRQQLTGRYDLRPLGDVVVKGRSEAVAIFEVREHSADAAPGAGHRPPTV